MLRQIRQAATRGFRGTPQAARRATRGIIAAGVRVLPQGQRSKLSRLAHWWLPAQADDAIVEARMRLGHRMRVDLRSQTEFGAYYTGDYDTAKMRLVLGMLKPGAVILDVGANIGFWTVPMARRGCVYAFEPVPSNYRRLEENIKLNGSGTKAYPFGLSDREGEFQISLREDLAGGAETGNAAIVSDQRIGEGFESIGIRVKALDDVAPSLGLTRLDFIKLDIEGHEDFFLRGARETIARTRPVILMEVNGWYYHQRDVDPDKVFGDWMREMGYRAIIDGRDGWRVRGLGERTRPTEDVFLVPGERAGEIEREMIP